MRAKMTEAMIELMIECDEGVEGVSTMRELISELLSDAVRECDE
jgi:hypothetical protein